MHTENYQYKAFISYRHLPYDKAIAAQLQRILEGYKPPAPLRESGFTHWRLFRDETELPTSSDLGQDIYHALEHSEFLICICSEDYPESRWCMAEIEYFKSLHHGSIQHIIPLLISGEPDTSFPELLRFDEEKQQQVEPLAANITADTEKASMRRLCSTEYLRIAAQMLHCPYDTLYQRQKRRERKRKMLIRAGAGGILAVIAGISAAYMVSLSHKNAEILRQNDLLENNQQLILSQNQDLLIENSRQLAVESSRLFQEGNYISAIQTALDALPSEHTPRPVVPEAEHTLSEELFAFSQNSFVPGKALTHDTTVEDIICTDNGQTAVTRDAYSVYVWNTQTGELLQKYPLSDFRRTDRTYLGLKNKIMFYHAADCPVEDVDLSPGVGILFADTKPGMGMIVHNKRKLRTNSAPSVPDSVYIYNEVGDIWKLSEQTGEILWENKANTRAVSSLLFCENEVIRIREPDLNQYNADFVDMNTGEVKKSFPILNADEKVYHPSIDKDRLGDYNRYDGYDDPFGTIGFSYVDYNCYDGSLLTGSYNSGLFLILREEEDGFKLTQTIPFDDANKSIINGNACNIGGQYYTMTYVWQETHRTVLLKKYDSSFQSELWRTSLIGNDLNMGIDISNILLFRGEDTGIDFDVIAAVINGEINIIRADTGERLNHISLNSDVAAMYYSKSGIVFIVDQTQHEYAITMKTLTNDLIFQSQAIYDTRNFVTGTALCGYCNDTYVTADGASNTAYVYTESANPDFEEIDMNDILPERTKDFTYNSAAVSPDADLVAVSYCIAKDEKSTNYFCLFDRVSGKQIKTPYDSGYTVERIVFMEGSKLLLTLYPGDAYKPQVHLYDMEQQKELISAENIGDTSYPWYTYPDKTCMIFWDYDSRNSIAVHSDGTMDTAPDREEETKYTMKDKERLFTFSPNVTEFAAVMKASPFGPKAPEPEYQLMICSFSQQCYRTISLDSAGIGTEDIQSMFYPADGQLCVLTYDGQILCFDTENENLLWKTTTKGIPSAVFRCTRLHDTDFLLLGTDMCLYLMTKDGFTGTKVQLSSDYEVNQLDSQILTEENAVLITLKDQNDITGAAWLLDMDTLTVRYHTDRSFLSYNPTDHRLYVYNIFSKNIGSFPIYTTEQLTEKAHNYLKSMES